MRLVFLGSGAFGLPTLESLAREHEVALVVTQPDKPAGRDMRLTPTPVGAWSAEHLGDTLVIKPPKVNDSAVVAQVREVNADAWVVIAFGQKLGAPLLADRFAVNLHASLLPRWRGAAPINHAILAGDAQTGNSVIALAERMDAGLVYAQSRRAIAPGLTAGELHDLLASDGPALVLGVLDQRRTRAERGAPQDDSLVTLAGKLSKADGWVDFREPAEVCRRRVHGLTPWPGVTATLRGEALKLLRVEALGGGPEQADMAAPANQPPHAPGAIVDPARGVVACAAGTALRLLEVQPAGKRAMAWADFARGRPIAPGELLHGGAPC